MSIDQNAQQSLFDALHCDEEEKWVEIEHQDESSDVAVHSNNNSSIVINGSLSPLLFLQQDLFWDDEELQSLLFKEKENAINIQTDFSQSSARKEAVEWILKVRAYYGFATLTAVLAVNYLDRFLSGFSFQNEKPWMMQLAAVACLSLACKVEETHVPLLLDLQVEDAQYVFEAKTIQRMELLVLSALKWRMNPVSPLSFLDHFRRRLDLRGYIHWEFLSNCENLLLSFISDSRSLRYMPSVVAVSTMLHVIHRLEPKNAIDYENQLLGLLKISKEEVNECDEIISDILSNDMFVRNPHY